jgi:hypothetical protein
MAKASPMIRAFNGGEFSELMRGRTDLDRYNASTERMLNYIAVPQGPAIGRTGTWYVTPVRDETKRTAILPFIFAADQAFLLEFSPAKMRVIYESGPLMSGMSPYVIDTPYAEADLPNLRALQSGDVVFLFCDGYAPRKLSRYGLLDWRLALVDFFDGPYLPANVTATRLTPNVTGELAVTGTVIGTPVAQTVEVEYTIGSPTAITGYLIKATGPNDDPNFAVLDSAPSDWKLSGYNGTTWVLLDEHYGWELYDNRRTPFFRVKDTTAYQKYKIEVSAVKRNGDVLPDFAIAFGYAAGVVTLTASSTTGINRDQGFLSSDVGRLLRYKSPKDGSWSALKIVSRVSSTVVTASLQGAPLADTRGTFEWRLGYWSATTGWPTCGTFFGDRLYMGGSVEYPDVIAGSRVGSYEDFSPSDEAGVVADDNAIVFQLNSRRIARICWLQSDERGLLIGTGSGEWVISSADRDGALTARSFKASNSTARGSAQIEPVKVDRQVVYVQRTKRTAREFAYVFEADGYKSPSMSLFASHIGVTGFQEMDFAAEPHSIIWFRRGDGKVAGLTYNRDENVVGWHVHDFSGGFVESMAVVPNATTGHDDLWIVVRRVIGGITRRYIERMGRTWDFGMTAASAHYVDSAVSVVADPPSASIVAAPHLEGQVVYGLADGSPFTRTVVDGGFTLPYPVSQVIVGLGYDADGITHRIEAGAADGTAQGKLKRIHSLVLRVWDTGTGLVGPSLDNLEPLSLRDTDDLTGAPPLRTEDIRIEWTGDYERGGRIAWRRPKDKPLPFNIIALMPQIVTQDG